MSNAREEILRLATDRLRNKAESVMFNINMILSNPEGCDNQVGKVSELIVELTVTESAMRHSQDLLTQCLALKLKELEVQIKETKQP